MKPMAARDPFKLGILTLVLCLVLGLGIAVFSVIPFGKDTYTAVLAQSAGLRVSEDVQVGGVRVGEVRSVKLDGDSVRVSFTVSKGVQLGSRTTAAVKVATLLGTHLLAVTPAGSGSLPDRTIALANTSVPFNLQDVLDQGTHRLEQLDAPKIARMLGVMADELGPSSADVAPALQGVVRLSDVVAKRSDQFEGLLKAARSVTTQLSASSGDIIELMKQTNLVIDEVTARRQAIRKLLVESTRLARNVNAVIKSTKADVHPALTSLNAALAELRRQDKTLRGVLQAMAPAVRYLANASGNAAYGDLYVKAPAFPPNDASCVLLGSC